jgi:ABC-type uncharacterized transport system permease subunit
MSLQRVALIAGMLAIAAWVVLPPLLKPFFNRRDDD